MRVIQVARNYIRISRNLAVHGETSLARVLPKIIVSRLFYGMGPELYDMRRFSKKRLCQIREYLSLRERENLQKSLCPKEAWELVDNKLLFYEKCLSQRIPTPHIFGVFMVSDVSVPDGIVTFKEKRGLRDFFRSLPSGQYVVKPTHGGHGWGVTAVSIESGKVTNLFGQSIDLDEFYLQCNDNRYNSSGFLFQEFVRPHRMLKQIMPGPALGTFRIVTFLSGDKSVNIPYAVVKIPVGSNVTDNFDAGSSGNWVCPVDVNTGGLGNAVGRSDSTPVVSERERHLDTGAVFREIEVPCWKEVKSTIIRAARVFADLRTLGWDVAITDDGASILEANWAWGENIIEVAQNRGLKSELIELTERSLLSASGEGN